MNNNEIREKLFLLADAEYAEFISALVPTTERHRVIGVRIPQIRALAKQIAASGNAAEFTSALPHEFFDENNLHAFVIAEIKDYDECLAAVKAFLPYIDSWATCDSLNPKVFDKHKAELLPEIRAFIASDSCFTARYGIGLLMKYFLDKEFVPEYNVLAASNTSEEYYVKMMVAWYFATALAKQYEATIPCIENRILPPWTHNKAIRKAIESRRLTDGQKDYLRTLAIK